jgi:ABC-2 type transport system ATP-binding protein
LLERLGLVGRLRDKAGTLSGGGQRKVEIVRALLHRPALLLLDEPSSGLDPTSRERLVSDMLSMAHDERTAVLWATHLLDEAERCDRVVVLHEGRIRADAAPAMLAADRTLSERYRTLTDAA